jgi:hypothetical protein
MSVEDFTNIEENLFGETYDNVDVDYYEKEIGEVDIPDPVEASNQYMKLHPELEEDYESIDEDEENAYDSATKDGIEIQRKFEKPIHSSNSNTIKTTPETEEMKRYRKIIYTKIKSGTNLSIEQCDMYSRCLFNNIWFGIKYNKDVEKILNEILEKVF